MDEDKIYTHADLPAQVDVFDAPVGSTSIIRFGDIGHVELVVNESGLHVYTYFKTSDGTEYQIGNDAIFRSAEDRDRLQRLGRYT